MVNLSLQKLATYFISCFVAAVVGHFFVRLVLKKFPLEEKGGLAGAGAAIGVLERILTLALVLAGQYTALGLILAAKSVARFEELKDRKFAEYYLIGTLSSMLFAMLVGMLTSWLLRLYDLGWYHWADVCRV
jgi:predicted permease